ncbi:MAG: VRR-NUC domain-containing protein [Bellilinea sp.]
MTPEGAIKAKVKKVLAKYGDELDAFWPVQNGMGSPALDCIVCYRGHHIEIETKSPGKKPTPRQLITIAKKEAAGAKVFVIDGEDGYAALDAYLQGVK